MPFMITATETQISVSYIRHKAPKILIFQNIHPVTENLFYLIFHILIKADFMKIRKSVANMRQCRQFRCVKILSNSPHVKWY